jgi:hypothetical protein
MKPATMFARTVAPLLWLAAVVPKAPRWYPVNCVPVLPEYTIDAIFPMPFITAFFCLLLPVFRPLKLPFA